MRKTKSLLPSSLVISTMLIACTPKSLLTSSERMLENTEKIAVDELTVNYTYSSNFSKKSKTLLLIHGFGASLESWNDIVPSLEKYNSIVRLDLRGHGLTDKPKDKQYKIEDQALLVIKFIKALQLKHIILVGHSYGGGIALMTYLISMDMSNSFSIDGLVLIASAGYKQKFPFFVEAVKNPATQFISNMFPSTYRARVLLKNIFLVQSQITEDRVETYAKYFDVPGAHYAISQCALHLIPEDLDFWISKYKNISVPVLLIWGQQDSVISTETGKRFEGDIPGATLVIFPNTGHVPHEERPLLTYETIQNFLGSFK